MSNRPWLSVAGVLALAGSCAGQTDSFHAMQIEQVIGGVKGDTTKQAIQLRMRAMFQNQVQNARLIAFDAAGANPVIVIAFPASVGNFDLGDHVLVTTAEFNGATSPACTPDFTMSNPIPASYLAAGRLCFQDNFGTTYWSLSWGGAAYTGSTLGSIINDADGNFGPPFPGPLPSSSTQALRFTGPASAPSTTNVADYALTSGAATFTNNLRAAFTISTAPPCYANCDNSSIPPILNVGDFSCFINKFFNGDTYANCDLSTIAPSLNILDFACYLNKFAAGC